MRTWICVLTLALSPSAFAEEVRIVLWNAEQLFNVDAVNDRTADLAAFGARFPDADVVILDEVTSIDVVNAARDKMGFTGFHTACSDFSQNDGATFNSLEVGVISRFPLANVLEFDPTPDNTGQPGEPAEQALVDIGLPGISNLQTSRGFLTADIPALGVTLACTHLKSSQGSAGQVAD